MLNPIEEYARAGQEAARAINENDWPRNRHWALWAREAIALETPRDAENASQAYDAAYRRTRKVPKVRI